MFDLAGILASVTSIKDVLNAAKGTTQAVAGISSSVRTMMKTGKATIDERSAKATRERLIAIGAGLSDIYAKNQVSLLGSVEAYRKKPTEANWKNILDATESIGKRVADLLQQIGDERSEFVLEKNYRVLLETLTSRKYILISIRQMPQPKSKTQKIAFNRLVREYEKLVIQLNDAIDVLSEYLKKTKNEMST
jgi:hypothetical protein